MIAVAVTGATGAQGGATARALLAAGHQVRAPPPPPLARRRRPARPRSPRAPRRLRRPHLPRRRSLRGGLPVRGHNAVRDRHDHREHGRATPWVDAATRPASGTSSSPPPPTPTAAPASRTYRASTWSSSTSNTSECRGRSSPRRHSWTTTPAAGPSTGCATTFSPGPCPPTGHSRSSPPSTSARSPRWSFNAATSSPAVGSTSPPTSAPPARSPRSSPAPSTGRSPTEVPLAHVRTPVRRPGRHVRVLHHRRSRRRRRRTATRLPRGRLAQLRRLGRRPGLAHTPVKDACATLTLNSDVTARSRSGDVSLSAGRSWLPVVALRPDQELIHVPSSRRSFLTAGAAAGVGLTVAGACRPSPRPARAGRTRPLSPSACPSRRWWTTRTACSPCRRASPTRSSPAGRDRADVRPGHDAGQPRRDGRLRRRPRPAEADPEPRAARRRRPRRAAHRRDVYDPGAVKPAAAPSSRPTAAAATSASGSASPAP